MEQASIHTAAVFKTWISFCTCINCLVSALNSADYILRYIVLCSITALDLHDFFLCLSMLTSLQVIAFGRYVLKYGMDSFANYDALCKWCSFWRFKFLLECSFLSAYNGFGKLFFWSLMFDIQSVFYFIHIQCYFRFFEMKRFFVDQIYKFIWNFYYKTQNQKFSTKQIKLLKFS